MLLRHRSGRRFIGGDTMHIRMGIRLLRRRDTTTGRIEMGVFAGRLRLVRRILSGAKYNKNVA